MPTRSLPPRPSLAQLKIQANELHQEHRDGRPSAAARIAAHHPTIQGPTAAGGSRDAAAACRRATRPRAGIRLRQLGASSKQHVELADAVAAFRPHPALRRGRSRPWMPATSIGCAACLQPTPRWSHARTNLEPPYHYFTGATLLHHVAGNPDRGRLDGTRPPLPANSAETSRGCSWMPAPTSTHGRSARTAATRWAFSSRANRPATRTSWDRSSTCC